MKPAKEWTLEDLQGLIGLDENAALEFKDARSLLNEDKKKDEIAKDVSAMANAAGGFIVYGIGENSRGVADKLSPIPFRKGISEWLEQVISTNIEPKIHGIQIQTIIVGSDDVAIVVEIPKATTFAPHQSTRHSQYFRRWNRTIQAMLDHEVRDLMRRSASPAPYAEIEFSHEHGDAFKVLCQISNASSEPSLYTFMDVRIDKHLSPSKKWDGWIELESEIDTDSRAATQYKRIWSIPDSMPIMKELHSKAFEDIFTIKNGEIYLIQVHICSPGHEWFRIFELKRMPNNEIETSIVDEG